jgi:hypothetical protein
MMGYIIWGIIYLVVIVLSLLVIKGGQEESLRPLDEQGGRNEDR